MPQTSRLLITCKELYTAEKVVLQKLPKVCDMTSGHGLKMFRLMVGVPNSRWIEWLNTSGVEELKLPADYKQFPRSVTDEEMLIMFGGERLSNLQSLDLRYCKNITDASVMEVARQCSNLQTLNLEGCRNITSACKNALRQSHPKLELED